MSVVFIFASCSPGELLELRRFDYLLLLMADYKDVEKE